MPEEFYKPAIQRSNQPLDDSVPIVSNVKTAFESIYDTADFLSARDGAKIPDNRYTSAAYSSIIHNHIQGLQRLPNRNYMVISGGDQHRMLGSLFVVKMESRGTISAWRSNVLNEGKPPREDKIVAVLCPNDANLGLDGNLWHVGGVSTCGDVVAAPAEAFDGRSAVIFYNFHNPEAPKLFGKKVRINRPDRRSGAVALTSLPNGYKLAAVLGLHNNDGKRYIDLYVSKVAAWSEGFDLVDSFCVHDKFDDWQNMNLIQESSGKLYLAATRNTRIIPGTFGKDMAHLFEVKLNPADLDRIRPNNCAFQSVSEVCTRHFKNKVIGRARKRYSHYQSNMAAGAGVYIHPSGSLFIYSCFHWRYRNRIAFAEYRPDPKLFTPDTIDSLDDAWIDMFYHDTYKGRRIGLVGPTDARIADFGKLAVQGLSFGRQLSSVRFQIPRGWKLRLYRHKNFETRNDHLDLVGNGHLRTVPDLKKRRFGDKTRSCEYLRV